MAYISDLTQIYLKKLGVSSNDVLSFVLSNENNPSLIYNTAKQYGITTQMLAEVVSSAIPSIDVNGVRQFFKNSGLDSLQLDNSSAHLDPNYFKNLFDGSKLVQYQGINDNIVLGDGDDYVDAGPGDDTIKGNGGNDVLLGGSGNDNIDGGRGADYIEGGFGADKLYGGKYANSTYVYGYYQGNQWIPGYTLYTVDYSTNLIYGGGGDDYIEGGYGADVLDGGDGADTIYGGGSYYYYGATNNIHDHDIIYGRGGDDWIDGEEGDDVIYGGTGNDYIYGGLGSDTIYGEEGDDTIFAQNDSYSDDYTVDYVFGGAGNDTIYIASGDQADAGEGNDTITFRAGSSTAQAVTTALIVAGEGADRINAYALSASNRLIIDLTESTQSTDKIDAWSINDSTFNMAMEVRGFNIKYDTFSIGSFGLNGTSDRGAGIHATYSNKNYSQILTSASTPYLQKNFDYKNPNPDAYGKGFFVIQGASATASDSLSAATFIDAYGNNATYDKEDVHYFLINVGTSDMGLYKFKDDSGADNNVVADELTPVALFVGLRTEDFTTQDLFNVFIY